DQNPAFSPFYYPAVPPCPFDIAKCRSVLKCLEAQQLAALASAIDNLSFWTPTSMHILYQVWHLLQGQLHEIRAAQILALAMAFRDWHFRDWELSLDMLAPSAADVASAWDSLPASGLLSTPSQQVPSGGVSKAEKTADLSQASSSACSLEDVDMAAAAAAVIGPRLALLFEWKESLVSDCVEGLGRHLSYAAETWHCLRRVKAFTAAVTSGVFLPHLDLMQQQQEEQRFSSFQQQQQEQQQQERRQPPLFFLRLPPVKGERGSLPLLEVPTHSRRHLSEDAFEKFSEGASKGRSPAADARRVSACAAEIFSVCAGADWTALAVLCEETRGTAEALKRISEAQKQQAGGIREAQNRYGEEASVPEQRIGGDATPPPVSPVPPPLLFNAQGAQGRGGAEPVNTEISSKGSGRGRGEERKGVAETVQECLGEATGEGSSRHHCAPTECMETYRKRVSRHVLRRGLRFWMPQRRLLFLWRDRVSVSHAHRGPVLPAPRNCATGGIFPFPRSEKSQIEAFLDVLGMICRLP
ncbi:uncharacterized protein LOC34622264, partial [Cyclospora cayetanensis]|uniref:Uncharacterized protein LOC34622264 n=1 Tax=Cyclospora cayetanensis TaxID=88456 RepID=A0A6P6S1M7_9EIME